MERTTNSSTNDWLFSPILLHSIMLSLSVLTVVLNVVFTVTLLMKRPIEKQKLILIAITISKALNFIDIAATHAYRLELTGKINETTQLYCLLRLPTRLFALMTSLVTSSSTMLSALDLFLLMYDISRWRITKTTVLVFICASAILGFIDIIITYIVAFICKHVRVHINCHFEEIMDYWQHAASGYCAILFLIFSVLLYVVSTVAFGVRKLNNTVRAVELRDRVRSIKQTGTTICLTILTVWIPQITYLSNDPKILTHSRLYTISSKFVINIAFPAYMIYLDSRNSVPET